MFIEARRLLHHLDVGSGRGLARNGTYRLGPLPLPSTSPRPFPSAKAFRDWGPTTASPKDQNEAFR